MRHCGLLVGPPGSGKSHYFRKTALEFPGRYLVACPTIPLLEEQQITYFRAKPSVHIVPIHSERGVGSVQKLFDAALADMDDRGIRHAVTFVTHRFLMTGDIYGAHFDHLFIDEAPNAVQAGRFGITRSLDYFSGQFTLCRSERHDGWSDIVPTGPCGSWKISERDTLHRHLVEFESLARTPHGVMINATSWEEVEDRGDFRWVSAWSPHHLTNFDEVTIAGAGLLNSMMYRLATSLHAEEVAFRVRHIPARPRSGTPLLRLHYFVEGHRASTQFWRQPEGRLVLRSVGEHLAKAAPGYWSANSVAEVQLDALLGRDSFVKPKVAGLNGLAHHKSCAFIYSSQMVPTDAPLLMFGITQEEIEKAREVEDAIQFIWRGQLRDPAFIGAFDAYLYSRYQAEAVAERVRSEGNAAIELIGVDEAGVLNSRRPPRRRCSDALSNAKRKAQDAERKRRKREERARAEGREPGRPGRPKGTRLVESAI